MSSVKELIRVEKNDTISFGNYELTEKGKVSDFPFKGDLYKVKSWKEITKLERNDMFVYESVPGTAVFDLKETETEMSFRVEGDKDAQITVEMEEETDYNIEIDGEDAGTMRTNLGGKLSLSVELEVKKSAFVRITRA